MYQMVKKLFQFEYIFDSKVRFWVLLGPVFLVFNLFLISYERAIFNLDLWAIVVLGIVLIWQYQQKGVAIILFCLFSSACIKHTLIIDNHVWQFGLEVSVALGLFITQQGYEYMSQIFSSLEEKRHDLTSHLEQIKAELNSEESLHFQQNRLLQNKLDEMSAEKKRHLEKIGSLESFIGSFQNIDEKENFERKILVDENLKLSREVEKLQRENKEQSGLLDKQKIDYKNQIDDINQSHKQKLQSKYINETLFRMLRKTKNDNSLDTIDTLKNKITKLEQELEKEKNLSLQSSSADINKNELTQKSHLLKQYEKKLKEYKTVDGLYKQLKEQFAQKTEILHQTRQTVFSLQEELMAKQREGEIELVSSQEEILVKHLLELEKEISQLEEENQNLEKIIASFFNKEE